MPDRAPVHVTSLATVGYYIERPLLNRAYAVLANARRALQ